MSTRPIPQPPGLPIVGNIGSIDSKNFSQSISQLAQKYGEIFKLTFFGNDTYFLCSARLVADACDETRFCKSVGSILGQVRNGIGDGLFTAFHGEKNWGLAHRILTPSFGPLGINGMYDEMYDIATQLVSKWARTDAESTINVTNDFTRLTLDSIALCAMDKRLNSFYHEELHPFVEAMTDFLSECNVRSRKPKLELKLNRSANREYEKNINIMKAVAQEVIDRRRKYPSDKKDLLNAMLYGKDPKTGESLPDENIMNNMITFLIAGHETTSGLLSFTTYYLLKDPKVLQRAQQEVDAVVGRGPVKLEHMSKLPYIESCLREALRLFPTAGAFAHSTLPGTKEPVLLCGEYLIPAGSTLICFSACSQRDKAVWGPSADEFQPERMSADNLAKIPPGAFTPFGHGVRACIGRSFAWQEATLALALILQNFNLRMADPSYQLKVKQTLTVKPDNFFVKVSLRPGVDPLAVERRIYGSSSASETEQTEISKKAVVATTAKPMTILYGSNSGTCEGLAQKLALTGNGQGFIVTVKSLDSIVNHFPVNQPVVIITSSYEGQPPDNAAQFTQWLRDVNTTFVGAECAIFGCGHRDWASTYQKIPTVYDEELSKKGAKMLLPRGETNVASGTIFDDFDAWAETLWNVLGAESNTASTDSLNIEISNNSRASHLRHSVQDGVVLTSRLLTPEYLKPEKRFIEIRLPSTASYETGDYLAVLPVNDLDVVSRVLRRFSLPWDATMKIKKNTHSTIPTDVEMSVSSVLASYVEIHAPATKKDLQILAKYLGDDSQSKIDQNNILQQSVLDIAEALPDLNISFSVYLSMLPPMRIRQYSISSSPLADPSIASITFSLAEDKNGSETHPGVATHFLSRLRPNAIIQVSIRKSPKPFHPPSDSKTPLLLICAGTGVAPFRAFIQDRALKLTHSQNSEGFAPAVLIIGNRDPKENLHVDEFANWERLGAVKIYHAYSRASELSDGCKYAQDRMWRERKELQQLFEQGAKVFVCGNGALGKGVNNTVARMAVEWRSERGRDDATLEESQTWWESLRNERYAVDVFD